MNKLNTTSVSLAVTPTVVSTLFSHYLNRKPLKERPTAHLSYDEGLHLIRSFLDFASHHTVEELQSFTAQWVPHPRWVKVEEVKIVDEHLTRAAELLKLQLGPDGIRQVGGEKWWQWRLPKGSLKAEWIEMRADASERKKKHGGESRRVMLYVHGGAYFFGSVDEHRYQMQRHARKLKARVFAPRYRLSPQFPFPCGLQDCLAAYLFLLKTQDPATIVFAGDSAGGGMVVSLLCLLRDQGIPLPAGAILISPWVDLTHSFPSVAEEAPLDYIPQAGFHHKPSKAWPPPNDDDINMLREQALKRKKSEVDGAPDIKELENKQQAPVITKTESLGHSSRSQWINGGIPLDPERLLSVVIDDKEVKIKDQIQMYTTNEMLAHPLVSPVMQPTLGGLPPLLIMVGGGEILRDEQIYLAHKCANPRKYAPPPERMNDHAKALLAKHKPTDVQLQVWDDLCHVAPTLSFTRPAKHMYRSVAQFGAWALARAQQCGIEIMDDDDISVISSSGSDSDKVEEDEVKAQDASKLGDVDAASGQVGKAGDPLPAFESHMIRQRVTRHGAILPLVSEVELAGCRIDPSSVGVAKEGPVRKWLDVKQQWDHRYATAKAKVYKRIVEDMVTGYHDFGPDECPPPTALAGRRRINSKLAQSKKRKSFGLAIWALWGSKHDEMTVEREKKLNAEPQNQVARPEDGQGARSFAEIRKQGPPPLQGHGRSQSKTKTVVDENQTGLGYPYEHATGSGENTAVDNLLRIRREKEANQPDLPSADFVAETGAAGKRPFLDGIALPFSLNKEADTASMLTLNSAMSPAPGSRPMSYRTFSDEPVAAMTPDALGDTDVFVTPSVERPGLDTFTTAQEGLPTLDNKAGEAIAKN